MKKKVLIILVLSFILTSCVTPKPKLTKRYVDTDFHPESVWENKPEVAVSVFGLQTPSSKKTEKSVIDLSEKAQAEYIKAISKKSDDANEILNLVFKPYSLKKNVVSSDRSRIKISRRLVFSLQKQYFRPADRLEEATTTITIPGHIKFVNWKQYENKYTTIKPGTLTLDQTNITSLGGSISIPQIKGLGDITLNQELARALSETSNLDKDIVQFWALLASEKAVFFQKGASSIDLSGTFIVDVNLEFNKDNIGDIDTIKFTNLFNKDKANPTDDILATEVRVYYPIKSCDIEADLKLKYTVRKVSKGDQTITESDDEVDMIVKSFESPIKSIIVPSENLLLYVWYIVSSDERQLKWEKKNRSGYEALTFGSFAEAEEFLRWLKIVEKKPMMINRREIGFVGNTQLGQKIDILNRQNISNLRITLEEKNACE